MTSCECNDSLMTISLSILVLSLAITMISTDNHSNALGNTLADGYSYLANGEIHYIEHPMELPASPWFWVVMGFVAIWKKWEIIWFFNGIVDYFKKTKHISTSEMDV